MLLVNRVDEIRQGRWCDKRHRSDLIAEAQIRGDCAPGPVGCQRGLAAPHFQQV